MAPPRRTARDYEGGITAASRTGLAEIMTTLGTYRDALVRIGGTDRDAHAGCCARIHMTHAMVGTVGMLTVR